MTVDRLPIHADALPVSSGRSATRELARRPRIDAPRGRLRGGFVCDADHRCVTVESLCQQIECLPDHGTCVVIEAVAQCDCLEGYTGETCLDCTESHVPLGERCREAGSSSPFRRQSGRSHDRAFRDRIR